MLPVSAISDAANKLRFLLSNAIDTLSDSEIRIGHPKDTFVGMKPEKNHLNLFFYNVLYDGYPADGLSSNPLYIRLHCLITAVGAKSNGSPSAGENDLRLIGEVMRVLHEQPFVALDGGTTNTVARLEIVPQPLSLDNLNHIWSTQGDTAYRLSVAYEMALAPVPLARELDASPRTGDPHVLSWGEMTRDTKEEQVGLVSGRPEVSFLEIDTTPEDWVPHICLVEKKNSTPKILHYVFKITGNPTTPQEVLIAGKDRGKVKLFWSVWRRKTNNSTVAWKEDIADVETPQIKEIKNPSGSTAPFHPNRIDPDDIDTRRIFKVRLPADIGSTDTKTWQAMLHAVHEWSHEDPAGSGTMKVTKMKSNALLLYGDG